ncbi:hypothetical protein ACFQ51_06935 [Streptomyces kaempferi]
MSRALAAPLEDDDLLLGDALHRSNQAHLATRAARHHNSEDLPRRTAPAEPGQPGTVTVAEHAGREVRIDVLAVSGGVQLAARVLRAPRATWPWPSPAPRSAFVLLRRPYDWSSRRPP